MHREEPQVWLIRLHAVKLSAIYSTIYAQNEGLEVEFLYINDRSNEFFKILLK